MVNGVFMKRAFLNKKESKQFLKDYKNFLTPTEKLQNIINSNSKNNDVINYYKSLSKTKLKEELYSFISDISDSFMSDVFGDCDFKIKNKKNYVFIFEDLKFIVNSGLEVVIPKNHVNDFFKEIISFEKYFINECIKYAYNNKSKISVNANLFLLKLESNGFCGPDFSFNFKKQSLLKKASF